MCCDVEVLWCALSWRATNWSLGRPAAAGVVRRRRNATRHGPLVHLSYVSCIPCGLQPAVLQAVLRTTRTWPSSLISEPLLLRRRSVVVRGGLEVLLRRRTEQPAAPRASGGSGGFHLLVLVSSAAIVGWISAGSSNRAGGTTTMRTAAGPDRLVRLLLLPP